MNKKHSLFIGCAAVLLAVIATLSGCPAEEDSEPPPSTPAPEATLRYETVPYRAASPLDTLITSAYDDTQNYYIFLLGHINRVPLTYDDVIPHNGGGNLTLGYTEEAAEELLIKESLKTATKNSVSSIYNGDVEVGFSSNLIPVLGSRIMASNEYGEYVLEELKTRSMVNTYATVRNVTRDADYSVPIGNNKPAGQYRYSLFGTTDVYYVVITDTKRKNVTKSYLSYCARPQTYWVIDYEPDLVKGSFGKTAPGELLEIPTINNPSALPTPVNNVQPFQEKSAKPTPSIKGRTYEGEGITITVSLFSTDRDAKIYYTTDNTDPTPEDEYLYNSTNPITITEEGIHTLKAIAVDGYKEPSDIMTETYTITLPPIQTEWTMKHSDMGYYRDVEIAEGNTLYTEYWSVSKAKAPVFEDFLPTKLINRGYTYFEINFSFEATNRVNNGLVNFKFLSSSTDKEYSYEDAHLRYKRVNDTFTVLIEDFDPSGTFSLQWSASDDNDNDNDNRYIYMLGSTEVKITAK
ncbi:MAG: chitobiase/beta-hexosaminidase C-terminal domain-containing protein [Treponema sp.]|jgi:hypothetical protein|nr:chitobiase/beta-hexosaminidase C-terminal domain-containing protein [Treponema sp.]